MPPTPQRSRHRATGVTVSIVIAGVLLATCVVYAGIFAWIGATRLFLLTLGFAGAHSAAIALNRKGRDRAGRMISLVTVNLGCVATSHYMGPSAAETTQLMAFPLSVLPLVLFDRRERRFVVAGMLAALPTYTQVYWHHLVPSRPDNVALLQVPGLEAGSSVFILALLILAVFSFVRTHEAAEAAFERSAAHLAAAFENPVVGIGHLAPAPDGARFTEVNQHLCGLVDRTRDELLATPFPALIHPSDRDAALAAIARIQASDAGAGAVRVVDTELRLVRTGGPVIWVDLTVSVVAGSEHVAPFLVVHVRDATARRLTAELLRQRREELAASHELYKATFDNAHIGLLRISLDGHVLTANQAMADLLGAGAPAALVGRRMVELTHPGDAEGEREIFQHLRARQYEAPPSWDKRFLRADGSVVHARKTMKMVYDPDGSPQCFLGVVQDMTEARESQRQLAEKTASLVSASKLATLGEMAGGVAHEVNNPLAIIAGKVRKLQRYLEQSPLPRAEVDQTLASITDMTNRIAKIVRGLRSFSRSADGDPMAPTALEAVVHDSIALCGERFRHHEVALTVGALPAGLSLECRETEISQVLINFLSNAFDAVVGTEGPWVRIEVADRGEHVELAVSDSGPGIPPALRDKIMQPFFTTKEVGKGSGLGLSISKGIVEGHGGRLELDEGHPHTRFVVLLPKVQRRAVSHQVD